MEQHLKFYCRSRGVPSKLLNGAVRKIAEEVELDGDAYRKLAGALSGGMKRRLSIAIAMCGSPKIMVLDEPTTGLDPDTRQHIWKLVSKVSQRPDRCVVITTHSMEEADALCSRIGIVCSGRLKVVGNQIRLKNNYGNVVKVSRGVVEDV